MAVRKPKGPRGISNEAFGQMVGVSARAVLIHARESPPTTATTLSARMAASLMNVGRNREQA